MSKSPLRPEDATALCALGRTLYGPAWQPALATAVGYSQSHVWQVSVGRHPVTDRLRMRLGRLVADAVRSEPDVVAERQRALAHALARFSN